MGISFKAGTDDLRYSPVVDVIEKLIGKGFEVKVYDKNVHISRLIGKNKSFIKEFLPHLDKLLTEDMQEVADWAELIVLNSGDKMFRELKVGGGKEIVDLVKYPEFMDLPGYEGILW